MTVQETPSTASGSGGQTGCTHTRSHITDSAFSGLGYSTVASRRIFCDMCRYQRWLDIEAALATAQAELGLIPGWAAGLIGERARVELIDLDQVHADIRRTRHSLVGLLNALASACPDGAGEYVHYGATTQDIQDTGQALEMRDVLDELDRLLRPIVDRLADLAEEHAATVAVGRTHAQPALPIGFGLKIASWLDELLRHAERLVAMRPRVLAIQLFGAVGTSASFSPHGRELATRVAARLGLTSPLMAWHSARDRVAEYVMTLAACTATAGRIADEIRTLSRPELGELDLIWQPGTIGSSTMPHKRNPDDCEQVVVMSRLAAGQVVSAMATMGSEHERDSRSWRIEWACVPDVSHYCLRAYETLGSVIDSLVPNPGGITANLHCVRDQIATEALMLALAPHLGKQTAYRRVYEVSQQAQSKGVDLRAALAEQPDLRPLLTTEELDQVFDPGHYIGHSVTLTRDVVAAARGWLRTSG
ncbi:adenylosuccinate lyase family protein [Nonomuraea sp. B19D2]|uniref:class-II fumarase/aspartase family protein n=1 Tax=Nonomuraea sp. B19D2 TaxID=3159561 RepID=UPI0032D9F93D